MTLLSCGGAIPKRGSVLGLGTGLLPSLSPPTLHHEMDRLWDGAELAISPHIQRKLDHQMSRCGDEGESGRENRECEGVAGDNLVRAEATNRRWQDLGAQAATIRRKNIFHRRHRK